MKCFACHREISKEVVRIQFNKDNEFFEGKNEESLINYFCDCVCLTKSAIARTIQTYMAKRDLESIAALTEDFKMISSALDAYILEKNNVISTGVN